MIFVVISYFFGCTHSVQPPETITSSLRYELEIQGEFSLKNPQQHPPFIQEAFAPLTTTMNWTIELLADEKYDDSSLKILLRFASWCVS